jgi:hypothetical protein
VSADDLKQFDNEKFKTLCRFKGVCIVCSSSKGFGMANEHLNWSLGLGNIFQVTMVFIIISDESFLRNQQLLIYSRNYRHFMEPEGSVRDRP